MHVDGQTPSEFAMDDSGVTVELDTIHSNMFNGEAVEGIFRGKPPGLALLAVTSRRLMMVDTDSFDGYCALMSVPLGGVTGVGFLASEGEPLESSTTIGMVISRAYHVLICDSEDEARELHDILVWAITS